MQRISLVGLIYLVIGVIVAANHGYLGGIHNLDSLASALLAIFLWPLLFFGANLHIVL